MTPVNLGRNAYWLLGWLLTIIAVYIGTQYARARGLVVPVVPGSVLLILGAVLCAIGFAIARRFGRPWAGVLVGGLGIVSVGLGLANLVR